jgi:predicted kinase
VLYLMVGLPASGKTTRAREIARERNALRLTPDEWMIPLFGESGSEGKRDVLEGRLIALAMQGIAVGTSSVLDFGFWSRDERASLRWLARSVGGDAEVLYLAVDEETQRQRIRDRWSTSPEGTFPITDEELASWRAQFDVPDEAELDGLDDRTPQGAPDWSTWAAWRWPSLALG